MNKKGFTLIELLAVIVILAILALIVSPIISGVIKDAKIAAAARSLEGYAAAVETAAMRSALNGGSIVTDVTKLTVEAKNKVGITSTGTVTIDAHSGVVTSIQGATVDTYSCSYTESAGATCSEA